MGTYLSFQPSLLRVVDTEEKTTRLDRALILVVLVVALVMLAALLEQELTELLVRVIEAVMQRLNQPLG
jgi:hypothetical protein